MARTQPFDEHLEAYEDWFRKHFYVYESELEAVRHFIPYNKRGIEIGIGTGRFAVPLKIREGVEPSERLPLESQSYDFALMVTTICFVDDIDKSFKEVHRILKPGGNFIIGLVDKDSPLGKIYEEIKDQNQFYKSATFYSTEEVIQLLLQNKFENIQTVQTVFGDLEEIIHLQNFKEGYKEGGFVVINAVKKRN
jgi:SAM-dependent methyltransferase